MAKATDHQNIPNIRQQQTLDRLHINKDRTEYKTSMMRQQTKHLASEGSQVKKITHTENDVEDKPIIEHLTEDKTDTRQKTKHRAW